ncbi:HEAT repeat domain-containing protein [Haloarcula nitratireducens]|uniref:HEAT repeat domain-containing protein n=1 Tax=Haloarcula nitratireducens TaxID=2487749 RepID=A0AAW4PFT3_9EURY|nr:HEAT repeat domain-containing protein [Halomicroarcula nitratireducens]MBX0296684.1 HEAT repeat domain-containing protein [Halomicroarcula nitratireducens]
MQNTNAISQAHSKDVFTRVRPLCSVAFDWLTIEPIWRSYRRAGKRAAAVVGFGLIFLWYFVLAIPFMIVGALLTIPGIVAEEAIVDTVAPLALVGAIVLTAYGGYRAWSLLDDRQTVFEYVQNPNLEGVVDSFDYLHRDDELTRALAANAIATGMENVPSKVTKELAMQPAEVVFEVADLLHDKSVDVRQSGSEALVYLSEKYPEEVAKYRDDVYSGISYPDSIVQANCVIIAGNLAYYEPALADEVVQYVGAIIDDPDPEVRAWVAIALGLIHNEKSRELLQELQNDSEREVRQQASESLQAHNQRARTDTEARSDYSTV